MNTIERLPLVDEVVREMLKALESGEYAVGDKFATEHELSKRLGVGRSTVREALRALQARGLIEIKRGRGAFVRKTSEEPGDKLQNWFAEHKFQLLDFMEVRTALEPLAIRLCVERATEAEIEKIEGLLGEFEDALSRGNVEGLATSDEALHLAIAEASHNNLLQAMGQIVAETFREYRMKAFAVKGNARNALEPHQNIVRAIRARDGAAGVKEMIRHLEISREDIHKVVKSSETEPQPKR